MDTSSRADRHVSRHLRSTSRAVWGSVIAASVAFAVGGAFMKVSVGFTRVWPTVVVIVLFVAGATGVRFG